MASAQQIQGALAVQGASGPAKVDPGDLYCRLRDKKNSAARGPRCKPPQGGWRRKLHLPPECCKQLASFSKKHHRTTLCSAIPSISGEELSLRWRAMVTKHPRKHYRFSKKKDRKDASQRRITD